MFSNGIPSLFQVEQSLERSTIHSVSLSYGYNLRVQAVKSGECFKVKVKVVGVQRGVGLYQEAS